MSDSIYKTELSERTDFENRRIELLEKDYNNQIEAARQQQFLDDLRKNNYLLIGLVILLVVLVALLFLYLRQYREKVKKEQLQGQLDFLRAQMNPHFLFNSINNIYVLLQEDKDRAARILLKFSELLRYQLYDCNVSTIILDKELNFLINYIEFETLRYSNKIEVRHNLDSVEASRLRIAPLLLQPFIENAFKHTPKQRQDQSSIRISASVNNNLLSFLVSNTRRAETSSGLPGGIGMENVKKRLELLYPGRYKLDLEIAEHLYTINLTLNLAYD